MIGVGTLILQTLSSPEYPYRESIASYKRDVIISAMATIQKKKKKRELHYGVVEAFSVLGYLVDSNRNIPKLSSVAEAKNHGKGGMYKRKKTPFLSCRLLQYRGSSGAISP